MRYALTVLMAILLAAAVPASALADSGSASSQVGAGSATAAKKHKKKRCAKRKAARRHRKCAKPRKRPGSRLGGPKLGRPNLGGPNLGGPRPEPQGDGGQGNGGQGNGGQGGGDPVGETLGPDESKVEATRLLQGMRYTSCNIVPCNGGIFVARLHFCPGGRFVYETDSGRQRVTGTWTVTLASVTRPDSMFAVIDPIGDDGTALPSIDVLSSDKGTKITYFERLAGGGVSPVEIFPEYIERDTPCP